MAIEKEVLAPLLGMDHEGFDDAHLADRRQDGLEGRCQLKPFSQGLGGQQLCHFHLDSVELERRFHASRRAHCPTASAMYFGRPSKDSARRRFTRFSSSKSLFNADTAKRSWRSKALACLTNRSWRWASRW